MEGFNRAPSSARPSMKRIRAITFNFSGCKLSFQSPQTAGANSNAEGWAHYCEQMMLDEAMEMAI